MKIHVLLGKPPITCKSQQRFCVYGCSHRPHVTDLVAVIKHGWLGNPRTKKIGFNGNSFQSKGKNQRFQYENNVYIIIYIYM